MSLSTLSGQWKHVGHYDGVPLSQFLNGVAHRNPLRQYTWAMSLDELAEDIEKRDKGYRIEIRYPSGVMKEYQNKNGALEDIKKLLASQSRKRSEWSEDRCAAYWSAQIYHEHEPLDPTLRWHVRKEQKVLNSDVPDQTVAWGIAWEKGKDTESEVYDTESEVYDVYLVFRGTSSPMDWAANLMCSCADDKPGFKEKGLLVHEGFWNKLEECVTEIRMHLRELSEKAMKDKRWRLVVTGHSQGAGIAQLFYTYLQVLPENAKDDFQFLLRMNKNERSIKCIAFAGPSVVGYNASLVQSAEVQALSESLIRELKKGICNYVYQNDPVPRFYNWPGLVAWLQKWGLRFSKTSRALGRLPAFACNVAARIIDAAAVRPLMFFIGGGSAIAGRKEVLSWIQALSTISKEFEDAIKMIRQHGRKFTHVAQIKLLRDDKKNCSLRNWIRGLAPSNVQISHHRMEENYAFAMQRLDDEESTFVQEEVEPQDLVEPDWEELCKRVEREELGAYEELLSALQMLPVDRVRQIKQPFLVKAVKLNQKNLVFALLRLGVDIFQEDAGVTIANAGTDPEYAKLHEQAQQLIAFGLPETSIPDLLLTEDEEGNVTFADQDVEQLKVFYWEDLYQRVKREEPGAYEELFGVLQTLPADRVRQITQPFLVEAAKQSAKHHVFALLRLGVDPFQEDAGVTIANADADPEYANLHKQFQQLLACGVPETSIRDMLLTEDMEGNVTIPDRDVEQLKVILDVYFCLDGYMLDPSLDKAALNLEEYKKKLEECKIAEDQKDKRRLEVQHELLDTAKYGDFDKMRQLLTESEEHRNEAANRPVVDKDGCSRRRWSAAMQCVYMRVEMHVFEMLLHHYPNALTVLHMKDKELGEVEEEEKDERLKHLERTEGFRRRRPVLQPESEARLSPDSHAPLANPENVSFFLGKFEVAMDKGQTFHDALNQAFTELVTESQSW